MAVSLPALLPPTVLIGAVTESHHLHQPSEGEAPLRWLTAQPRPDAGDCHCHGCTASIREILDEEPDQVCVRRGGIL